MFNISAIFGGKSWYKSLTAWGVVLWAGLAPMLSAACGDEASLLPATTCATLSTVATWAGSILTVLGVRKAATAPNAPIAE